MASEEASHLYEAFVGQDPAKAIQVVERVRSSGVPQSQLFDTLYVPAMSLLGGAWAEGLIDEIVFTQASVVAEQIGSFVMPPVARPDTGVTVVIGSIHRDRHSVMKDVVASALKEAGFRVNDLGVDVRAADFLERLEETGSRIVIVFAEILATARAVSGVRDLLTAENREDVVLLVAGGPFAADPGLARAVGANGVIASAESALKVLGRVRDDILAGGAS
ncbi:MAG: hypothetical protein CVT59_06770 [Actinobacteria bacterium HGW-Actinobacteria-1]|nr:MAG: hypothetical protein CVT59_06770 [Actinobacteria bacterium HGW-Actinobacteria-1]